AMAIVPWIRLTYRPTARYRAAKPAPLSPRGGSMLITQRLSLRLPASLLALAVAAPACTTTVIGGPLDTSRPADPTVEPLPRAPGEAPAPDTGGAERPTPKPPPPPSQTWERLSFKVLDGIQSDCDGDRYVKYAPDYGVWVGAILCSPTRYKLVMSE